jgi:hypothetical protein
VAEPASAPPAAELPVAAAAPEGRTVEIPDFLRDTTQTVSVPEAMDQVRGFLGDAVDESQEYFRADSLFMADQTLRALYPVVGQNPEMEELSSQYRDQLARVPVEEIRESAAYSARGCHRERASGPPAREPNDLGPAEPRGYRAD